MIEWLNENWLSITVPTIVFLAFFVVAIWARRTFYNYLDRLFAKIKWEGSEILLQTTKAPFLQWCLIAGAYAAILVSTLSPQSKVLAGRIIGSIFVISLTWTVVGLAVKLLQFYLQKIKAPFPFPISLIINAVRIAFIVIGVLMLLDIWKVPTTPLMKNFAVYPVACHGDECMPCPEGYKGDGKFPLST